MWRLPKGPLNPNKTLFQKASLSFACGAVITLYLTDFKSWKAEKLMGWGGI